MKNETVIEVESSGAHEYTMSAAILFVCIGTFGGYGRIPVPPVVSIMFLLLALFVLAYFEGLQVAVVNAQAMPHEQTPQLAKSVPRAYEAYMASYGPGSIEKFMIGRQLVVIITVFLISRLTLFPTAPIFLPAAIHHALITSGLPGVMIALTFAQMSPQLVADEYTLRFLNMPGCVTCIKLSMWIESLGIFTHFSWAVTNLIKKFYCIKNELISTLKQIPKQIPLIIDTTYTAGSVDSSTRSDADLIEENFNNDCSETSSSIDTSERSGILDLIPMSQNIQIRLQIAVLSIQHLHEEDIHIQYQRARKLYLYLITNSDTVKRFLIDSLVLETVANWGFAGILLTLNIVQMPSQMLAKTYAIQFINLPGAFSVIYISLAVEAIGITHCGWVCFAT
eukprot:gene1927-3740_t